MKQYLDLVQQILDFGELHKNRTGIDTLSIFGGRFYYRFPVQDYSSEVQGFPLLTTKKMGYKTILSELLWFLEGSSNERRLARILYGSEFKDKKTIWTLNYEKQGKDLGYTDGELGPIYGIQWRNFFGIDQIKELIKGLKEDPFSRRHLVSAWNPAQLDKMALPPCHLLFQVYVHGKDSPSGLSLQWYQRSVDTFLGLPFNIASYATLLCMLCQVMKVPPVSLIGSFGDLHLYVNSLEQVEVQLQRTPYSLPSLQLPEINNLDDILLSGVNDYKIKHYQHYDKLTCSMAV